MVKSLRLAIVEQQAIVEQRVRLRGSNGCMRLDANFALLSCSALNTAFVKAPRDDNAAKLRDNGIGTYRFCRAIGASGVPNFRSCDVASADAAGLRPRSYGLQDCELTVRNVVEQWKNACGGETSDSEVSG